MNAKTMIVIFMIFFLMLKIMPLGFSLPIEADKPILLDTYLPIDSRNTLPATHKINAQPSFYGNEMVENWKF